MNRGRVLVVDDEPAMLENLDRLLSREGYECRTLENPLEARAQLAAFAPDVLLLDLMMPGADGMTVLAAALADDATLPVIMITAHATVQSAVRAMREGAFDYLTKPFSGDQLLVAVERATRFHRLAVENRALRERVEREAGFEAVVGSSPALERVLDQVRKVAPSGVNVLITGESGTGKELIARCIHDASPRRAMPFMPVDCAALPAALLESELFGHERGAFTGAVERRHGLLAEANGGTVFFDEIGEMAAALQAKLLRALEERKIRRLGTSRLQELDIRVLAATNVNLEAAVHAGSFRQDLYYRLNVVHLSLPPLRERAGDIALLGQTFLERCAAELGREAPRLATEAWEALERYDWPGNVRELRNVMQRVVVLDDDGRVAAADLPENVRQGPPSLEAPAEPAPPSALGYETASDAARRSFRAAYLERLLSLHHGNVSRAAQSAGVNRRTIHRWLAELRRETPPS